MMLLFFRYPKICHFPSPPHSNKQWGVQFLISGIVKKLWCWLAWLYSKRLQKKATKPNKPSNGGFVGRERERFSPESYERNFWKNWRLAPTRHKQWTQEQFGWTENCNRSKFSGWRRQTFLSQSCVQVNLFIPSFTYIEALLSLYKSALKHCSQQSCTECADLCEYEINMFTRIGTT